MAYYLFDEGLGTLRQRSRALGLDVEPYMSSGHITIRTLDPAEARALGVLSEGGTFAEACGAAAGPDTTDAAATDVVRWLGRWLDMPPDQLPGGQQYQGLHRAGHHCGDHGGMTN